MRITLIGSGNVATHLAAAFKNAGHSIVQVYSRELQRAALLAYYVKAEAIDDFGAVSIDTDLFIIAVKDSVVVDVAEKLAKYQKLIVHTSGVTDLSALLAVTPKAGVFYPLQTLSKHKEIDFLTVPLCVEGTNETMTAELEQLAQTISNKVYRVNSGQRKALHLAAVFACNFPNYLYGVAGQLLKKDGLEFDLLRPLILETAQKVQNHLPAEMQTGPAVRNDENTMAAHLQMLQTMPVLQSLYCILSQEIIKNNADKHGLE